MNTLPLLITGGRLLDPSQGLDKIGDLLITDKKITRLDEKGSIPSHDIPVLNATGFVVCPGFIDLHCHLREPGFEEKETIATGTKAAARGGFTTLCCMPNTNPHLDNQSAVNYVKSRAHADGVVTVFPIGCITKGRKGEELVEMEELACAGVIGFSDDGKPVTNSRIMRRALEHSSSLGLVVIDHCEDVALTNGGLINESPMATRLGLKGIPAAAEEIMVARDLALAQLTGGRLHIAHVSTEGSVELIRQAKDKGIAVTAEVTPHHLTLTQDRVINNQSSSPYDTNAKVNPPLRTQKDINALITGLKEGTIDAIATDHAPHTLADKMLDFELAPFGISGLETAFGALMGLFHDGKLELVTLVCKLTTEPARIIGDKFAGLGTLKVGSQANLTILDPNREWIVDISDFASKGKNTPFNGRKFKGKVVATIAGGRMVYKDDSVKVRQK